MNERMVEFQHDLVPLSLAASVVYARVYETNTPNRGESFRLERMDGAATAIADLTVLYTYEPSQPAAFRRLTLEQMRGGTFRNGGNELHFHDGRQPLRELAVAKADLEYVLSLLEDNLAAHRGTAATPTTVRL